MIIEALLKPKWFDYKTGIIMIGKLCFFQNSFFLSINWQKIKFKTSDFSPTRHHKIVFSSQI